jgi:hypothetical protein
LANKAAAAYFRTFMRKGLLPAIKAHLWDALLVVLIVLELAFMLYFHRDTLPNWFNELGYTLTSVLIGIVLLAKYYGRGELRYISVAPTKPPLALRLAPYALLVCGMAVFCANVQDVFRAMPISPAYSDVIPTIQIAVQRLLSGQRVYAEIDQFGYQLPLTYLPMQWLPYVVAELLDLDYRWIAVAIAFLSAIVVVRRSSQVSAVHGAVAALLLTYAGWMLLKFDKGILGMTVELMVAGYYMLLVTGISGRNPWLRGAFIAICLLSRYSLVLWLPLWAFIEFTAGSRRDFFRSCAVAGLMVLLLYIIPFLSKDWGAFLRGYQYYSQAALGEWNHVDGEGHPLQLHNGLGFARLFYQHQTQYSVPERIKILQQVHLAVCIGVTLLMGVWYRISRRRIHPRVFLLASFKIYLSLFLAFIQVPYPYLMITAAAVSIAIFAELPRWKVR